MPQDEQNLPACDVSYLVPQFVQKIKLCGVGGVYVFTDGCVPPVLDLKNTLTNKYMT